MRMKNAPAWLVEQSGKVVFAGRGVSAIAEYLRRDILWRAVPESVAKDRPYIQDPFGRDRSDEIRRDYIRAMEAQAKRTVPTPTAAAAEPTP